MKVGDLVSRAYTWPELVCGIIVDEHNDLVDMGEGAGSFRYPELSFTIAWADGTTSRELGLEIESFEKIKKETGSADGGR